jgi:hypothetical protein
MHITASSVAELPYVFALHPRLEENPCDTNEVFPETSPHRITFFGGKRMTKPVPSPRKRPYRRPRLEPHPAWHILTAQVGSFPTRIPQLPEEK